MDAIHLIEYAVGSVILVVAFAAAMWVVGWLFGFGDSDGGRYSGF